MCMHIKHNYDQLFKVLGAIVTNFDGMGCPDVSCVTTGSKNYCDPKKIITHLLKIMVCLFL
jgi:hypothetical protein